MPKQSEQYHVSAFVFRRTLALGYCSAFLSLLAQAPGLFGCDGAFPPRKEQWLARFGGVAIIIGLASLGALVAGAAVAALGYCERYAFTTFALLWATFASCVTLAPALYPSLEDRLLLDVGLAALFLVAANGGKHQGSTESVGRGVGRILAGWLLFRAVFATCAQRMVGSCGAWRALTALADLYQIEIFPLTPVWLLWLAPATLVQAATFLQIYVEFVLSPLLLVPKRSVSTIAAAAQLLAVLGRAVCANQGVTSLCLSALALSQLDDGWHNACWSEQLLHAWGCSHLPGDDELEESEDDSDGANGNQEDKGSSDVGASGDSSTSALWVLLIFVAGFIAGLALVFKRLNTEPGTATTQQEPLSFLAASEGGHVIVASFVAIAALLTFGSLLAHSKGAPAFMLIGLLVSQAGLLQLVRDVGPSEKLPTLIPVVADALEHVHLAHPLGRLAAGEEASCPDAAGRADIVLQAALQPAAWRDLADDTPPEVLRSLAGSVSWVGLSSRFLPAADDRRPVWLQPYTPRLDRQLWKIAQDPEQQRQQQQQQMRQPKSPCRAGGASSLPVSLPPAAPAASSASPRALSRGNAVCSVLGSPRQSFRATPGSPRTSVTAMKAVALAASPMKGRLSLRQVSPSATESRCIGPGMSGWSTARRPSCGGSRSGSVVIDVQPSGGAGRPPWSPTRSPGGTAPAGAAALGRAAGEPRKPLVPRLPSREPPSGELASVATTPSHAVVAAEPSATTQADFPRVPAFHPPDFAMPLPVPESPERTPCPRIKKPGLLGHSESQAMMARLAPNPLTVPCPSGLW